MTPEEIINKQTWEILQDIKEESLAPEEDGTFFYDTTGTVIVAGEHSPSQERKIAIVHKLARDAKAIEIAKEIQPDWKGTRNGFYLKLIQPQFDEVYEKYKKACDLTSHLNDYQERMLKGDDNLPELYHIDDKEQAQEAISIKHKGRMFETGSGGGYYNRSHPIRPTKKQSANEIVDGFSSSNYAFVLMVSEGILSASEFGSDGEVNYQLQSAPGQLLMQERQLLSKFEELGLFRNLGEDGIFAIAKLKDVDTRTIRQIAVEIESRQSNLQTKPEDKSENLKTRYDQLLEEIRKPKEPAQDTEKRYEKTIEEIKAPNLKPKPVSNRTKKEAEWSEDFKWKGKTFVFGSYGKIIFTNEDTTKKMFKMLSGAKGNWVAVANMRKEVKKDANYIRSTLGQIRKRLPSPINLPSTREDNLELKPPEGGAYRIKFNPKP